MRNIAMVVAYDGAAYHGFQAQRASLPTIQGTLEATIARLSGSAVRLTGAGRTDAGVHAGGQVVNFRTTARLPVERWPYALNSVLPGDIVVESAWEAPESFHARFDATAKTYRYTIDTKRFPSVFLRRYAWHTGPGLDIAGMRQAAALLVGEHDFRPFCAVKSISANTRRRVDELDIAADGDRLFFTVTANGFLYHMVRIIVGTLVEVGRGKAGPETIERLLAGDAAVRAGQTAPAYGLCLLHVAYPADKLGAIGQDILDTSRDLP